MIKISERDGFVTYRGACPNHPTRQVDERVDKAKLEPVWNWPPEADFLCTECDPPATKTPAPYP